jgi:hypothetical protein
MEAHSLLTQMLTLKLCFFNGTFLQLKKHSLRLTFGLTAPLEIENNDEK